MDGSTNPTKRPSGHGCVPGRQRPVPALERHEAPARPAQAAKMESRTVVFMVRDQSFGLRFRLGKEIEMGCGASE